MLYPSVAAFLRAGISWRWKNFTPAELACSCKGRLCGSAAHGGNYFHDEDFLDKLQALRDLEGVPLRLTSAHRCPRRNKEVGGARESRHLTIAADISLEGRTKAQRLRLLENARKVGFTGIGKANAFLHVDTRPKRTEWVYKGAEASW